MKYDDMKMNKSAYPMPKASKNSNGGKDPGVKVIEKHPIKSAFWTKKKMKGDC
ncbi:MAG: hypothetical protein OEY86_00935 [Nitrospira sp.]|nr:hypothetical protein [Nitrospira sp.]